MKKKIFSRIVSHTSKSMHNYFEFRCISHFVLQLFFIKKTISADIWRSASIFITARNVLIEKAQLGRQSRNYTKISRNRLMGTKNCWSEIGITFETDCTHERSVKSNLLRMVTVCGSGWTARKSFSNLVSFFSKRRGRGPNSCQGRIGYHRSWGRSRKTRGRRRNDRCRDIDDDGGLDTKRNRTRKQGHARIRV